MANRNLGNVCGFSTLEPRPLLQAGEGEFCPALERCHRKFEESGSPDTGVGPYLLFLSDMIRYFKMFTTSSYLKGVKDDRFIAFENKLWQRKLL